MENSDSSLGDEAKKSSIPLKNLLTKWLVTGAFLHQFFIFYKTAFSS